MYEELLKGLIAKSSKDLESIVPVSHPLVAELMATVTAEGDN